MDPFFNQIPAWVQRLVSVRGSLTLLLSATPLPAALPLFAGGLGLIGFVAKRRKRNAAAPAAA